MKQIGVARFTDETYKENLAWKEKKQYTGSVYGFDREISTKNFDYMGEIYTIDIRCSKNTKKSPPHIYGIGKIRCITKREWRSRIYSNHEYNRFVYKGDTYKSRDELVKMNKENNEIIETLEKLLCVGARHFKRGDGLSKLTYDRIMSHDHEAKPIPQRCSKCGLLRRGHVCKKKNSKIRIKFIKRCKICHDPLKQHGGLAHICLGKPKNKELLKKVLKLLDRYDGKI
tara:strand:+ start:1734 stop:2417 length:684 start_codon:yes stop_codon:yes gene_type:complete